MSTVKLVSRKVFRETVLERANGVCCSPTCAEKAVDAHHILNRRLFTDAQELGGYFLNNGAQLCSVHHYEAELTKLTTEELREWCSIPLLLPRGWDLTKNYDTWGNEVISPHERKPGPLFDDEGFQKVMKIARLEWRFAAALAPTPVTL